MSRNPVFRNFSDEYGCGLCNYKVSSRKAVDLHMKYSHKIDTSKDKGGTRLYECGVCGKKFGKHTDFLGHIRKNHQYRGGK